MTREIEYQGGKISEPGVYRGISLAQYHENPDLFDGPSVSKSALKWLLPFMGGSPKAFWGRWKHNPAHVTPKTTTALDFGKAAHCLLLGDEVFSEAFIIRPDKAPDGRAWNGNNTSCREWLDAQEAAGRTALTAEQIETIRRMADDASKHPLVKQGILNGAIERTMAWKDPATSVWLKCRPDVLAADGYFADLKTASKFSEDFLERQAFDAGYWLQGAMTRMVCRELGVPFETFVLVYVLNDDVPDTTCVELSEHELDRGEQVIRWCIDTIGRCLAAGEWPGARPFGDGAHALQLKPWVKNQIDEFLQIQEAA